MQSYLLRLNSVIIPISRASDTDITIIPNVGIPKSTTVQPIVSCFNSLSFTSLKYLFLFPNSPADSEPKGQTHNSQKLYPGPVLPSILILKASLVQNPFFESQLGNHRHNTATRANDRDSSVGLRSAPRPTSKKPIVGIFSLTSDVPNIVIAIVPINETLF